MSIPANLKYTESHEWVRVEADGTLTVGITDHAQELLGDVVFVGLPEVGSAFAKGDDVVVVESVKAAADVYAPVAGTVSAVNPAVADSPESLNATPYEAWLYQMTPEAGASLSHLLDAATYEKHAANG
jgi:glycine cleavage system H protein